jgi:hypothetical protein
MIGRMTGLEAALRPWILSFNPPEVLEADVENELSDSAYSESIVE